MKHRKNCPFLLTRFAQMAGCLALWLSLLGNAQPAFAQGTLYTVHIYNFDFSLNPAGEPVVAPIIQVGDTVRWVWDEGFHSTTAVAGQLEFWDSPIQSGGTYDHLFTQIGVFQYYSRPFGFDNGDGTAGGMSSAITVIPEPATSSLLATGGTVMWLWRRQTTNRRTS